MAKTLLRYVKVAFPKSPLAPLTYSVPESYPDLQEGMRVIAPVGPRFLTGFVIRAEKEPEGFESRSIVDLLDSENLFSPVLLHLTRWMAEYYMADFADVLKAALPPALDIRPETLVRITESGLSHSAEHAVLQVLEEKRNLPLKEIYRLFGHRGTFSQLRALEQEGHIEIMPERKRKREPYNSIELVEGSVPPSNKRELEIYEFLRQQEARVPLHQLQARFGNVTTALRKMSAQNQIRRTHFPAALSTWPEWQEVERLDANQESAIKKMRGTLDTFRVHLLHGVTGSGKTEVYLRLAQEALTQNRSVLILVPEIALLPLITRRIENRLKVPISILHSELGESERLKEWRKARAGEVRLVVGTRSAVFAPLANVGLIVIDEEHDGSYKQAEYPRYHARETAIIRAQYENCPIVLGSATPSLESFFNAGNGKYEYVSLPERIEKRPMPAVRMIDMKQEYRASGDPVFSRPLLDQVSRRLEKKEQILLLQNRRGYAAFLMCRECGHVMECPHCSVTLTYHHQARRMQCHYCDYSRLAPRECEKCKSKILHLFGVGTEKIAEQLQKLYPDAKIERFDRDATRKKGSVSKILARFAAKEIDLLVGTQMLAKGHDFPNITLVGVIGADSAIGIPDFRSSERLYQLLTQVAGRSGRGIQPGLVLIQTYHPDHYAIQSALDHNYRTFYEKEIRFRRLMQYPPFVSLANLVFSGKDAKKTVDEARAFGKFILAFKTEPMKMLGPAIAPIAKLSGQYRFQILLKSPSRKELRQCLREAMDRFGEQKRLSKVAIDIDPYSVA